jgi:hypothetical protein
MPLRADADRGRDKKFVICAKFVAGNGGIGTTAPCVVVEVTENEKTNLTMHELRLMGSVSRALVVVSTVLGAAMLNPGAASADGPVQLRSRLGDVCLDAPTGSWLSPVVINPCNGSDFQRWNLTGPQLESVAFPGECLTMPGESWFSHLGSCIDTYAQHWSISPTARSRLILVAASPSSAALVLVLGSPPACAMVIPGKGGIAFRDRAC